MSFSKEVKEEIINRKITNEQKLMLLIGFIKYNGELIYTSKGISLKLTNNSNNVIRNIYLLLKNFYKGNIEISIIQIQKLNKNKVYQLLLTKEVKEFLIEYKIYDFFENKKIVNVNFDNYENKKNDKLIKSYLAGIFIAIGSVNSPITSNYHLEFQFKEKESAIYLCNILKKYNFDFKIITKKNKEVCYIKKSLLISDFLKFMEASLSVMKFETTRIKRVFNNNINRAINIDIYNQKKSIQSGLKQIENIKLIIKNKLFNNLSNKAQMLAKLRLQNPEASYFDLENKMNKNNIKITKSGISNLFKIIEKKAKNIGEENE